ncbi:MAG: glycerophosphodiester phosphodiesterase [Candidatus Saccharimonas sp.]|nr:glycerophosphodiester phosphodiesterase [Candidatus Saccharimonas sp.]
MLIIGHRGAAGVAPENTMAAFDAGFNAGADMLEFDVRLTKDHVPVVIHDSRLVRTHHIRDAVSGLMLEQLMGLAAEQPIPTLEEVLDKYFGTILLNIELKSRGSGLVVLTLLESKYIKKSKDWDNVILSSFKGTELVAIRRHAPKANLAMLHTENPFIFVAYQRFVQFTAVGFHRLYLNQFALEIAKKAGLFIYVYTVDRTAALPLLEQQGIDGIVTNYPDKFRDALER